MTKSKILALSALLSILSFSACRHASLEDRAEKMANDYTERNCPTPAENMTITDSVTFDRRTKTLNYYYTLVDRADNAAAIDSTKTKLRKTLVDNLKENTSLRVYKDASYNFRFVFRSGKTGKLLFEATVTPKDYTTRAHNK